MSTPISPSMAEQLRPIDKRPTLVLDITERVINNILHYDIQIVEQKYRCNQFNYGSCSFIASNGFILSSVSCPAGDYLNSGDYTRSQHKLYLRGSSPAQDNEVITIASTTYVEQLKLAVEEYNSHMK